MNRNSLGPTGSLLGIPAVLQLALFLLTGPAMAQGGLRTVLQGQGVDWIVGSWSGINEQGRTVDVAYEWDLDGHVLDIDLTIGDDAYEGMIVRVPNTGEIIEFGADSGGGMTRSAWRVDGTLLISERIGTRPDGELVRVAVVNRKVNDEAVISTAHALTADGVIGDDVLDTVNLTRLSGRDDDD